MMKKRKRMFTIISRKDISYSYINTPKGKKKSTFLGSIEAETSFSAYKKAIRIEESGKPCTWRGVDWTVKEFNSPFGYNNKNKKDNARKHCRRAIKKWDRQMIQIQYEDLITVMQLSVIKKEADGGNHRLHSYNGCVNWD